MEMSIQKKPKASYPLAKAFINNAVYIEMHIQYLFSRDHMPFLKNCFQLYSIPIRTIQRLFTSQKSKTEEVQD